MCIFDLKRKKNRFNEKLTDLTYISLHRSVWMLPSSKRHHVSDFLVVTDSIKMHQKLLCTGSCLKVLKGVIKLKRKNTTFAVPSASNANRSRILFESVEKPSNRFYSTLEDVPSRDK